MKTLLLLIMVSTIIIAQQLSIPFIKNSGQYYYGTGIAITEQEATYAALS